ncbi:hypothetical protein KY284_036115 [Solanum tuberosum]|nr:hypothetical protein KY284_036115 [Solanum tuberosum]
MEAGYLLSIWWGEINRNLVMLAKYLYPWLADIPDNWPLMVKFFEDYRPVISCQVVRLTCPVMGFKCNTDGGLDSLTGNFSSAFCIRDVAGNFVYVETRNIGKESVLMAEMKALMFGQEYCCTHNVMHVVLETDSLICKRVLDGVWKTPWSIAIVANYLKRVLAINWGLSRTYLQRGQSSRIFFY